MNPDTPSMEVCKRLAAAGWPQDPNTGTREFWFENTVVGKFEPWLGTHRDVLNVLDDDEVRHYAAPTIGEMLAEVTRRDWGVELVRERVRDYYTVRLYGPPRTASFALTPGTGLVEAISKSPADALALALALCAAVEEAKNGRGT